MRGRAQHKHGGDNGEGSEEDEAESEHESVISNRCTYKYICSISKIIHQ